MNEAEIKVILQGVYELSKKVDNPEYGASYKLRCLNQKSRLEAIQKGARLGLRMMGVEITENLEPIEKDERQMDFFEEKND